MKRILIVLAGIVLTMSMANANVSVSQSDAEMHSGGTDGNGCHHDRKRGGYHCH
ncbi:YHYH domain-containing protein [Marinobacter sp. SBS5]|uniref:YHYH domain-containing protein n=1 Tax=Marinobacter sp. SBS5 TaxID=3401754 RepID=UPI003AAFA059